MILSADKLNVRSPYHLTQVNELTFRRRRTRREAGGGHNAVGYDWNTNKFRINL
jgi:hypothetical protein